MIQIFSDGSSLGNPGPGGWGAIVVRDASVTELGGGESKTTNNRMELTGAIEALLSLGAERDDVVLYTDSKYTIDGITKWVAGWQRNGWQTKNKTEVLNRDLWERLLGACEGKNIRWEYVEGHAGIPGNERVDEIATSFAGQRPVPLYMGSRETYRVDISITKKESSRTAPKTQGHKAYSYLALVDGAVHRFEDWKSCESFVKGKPAKFRKALSSSDEKTILSEWGIVSS